MPEIFESAAFIDYSHKLSVHMAEQDTKNDVRVDVMLPGVLVKFDDQIKATKEILTEVTEGAVENSVLKGEIKTVVTDSIIFFTDYVGKYREYIKVMDVGIDQELVLTFPSPLINEHVGDISEATVTAKYTIPATFDSVQCLIDHLDTCIDLNEKKRKSQWQTRLKGSQQKKFSRIKFVVTSIAKRIKASEKKSDVIIELKTLYSTNKSSLAKFTDTVKKKNN